MNQSDLKVYLDLAMKVIDGSRQLILDKTKDGFSVETKLDKSVVTAIDRAAENFIKKEILQKYPTHGILGEEYGAVNESSDYCWFIDPIDGTEAFVKGSKDYGTLLALQYKKQTVLGIVDHPTHHLRYYAQLGGGAYRDGTEVTLQDDRTSSTIEQSPIAICRKSQFERHGALESYNTVWEVAKNVKEMSDCFGHTRVLEGEVSAMIDYSLHAWDIEATRILIEEAGGKFMIADEKKRPDGTMRYGIIFGKPGVVDWLCNLLQ